ncbi:MAG: hypothetical protein CSA03_03785 [Bacteroidetes bacterium]|nr:MAG: hypothetical protein CSA03_03785 [Bacteroidota bacterium]
MRQNNIIILNGISQVTLIDNAMVETRIEKDREFELKDAQQMVDTVQTIGNSRKFLHLTIFGERTVPSKEARQFSISKSGSQFKLAEAIVVQSLSQKMVFNFMINVERPSVRTKLFTSIDEAKKWLYSL